MRRSLRHLKRVLAQQGYAVNCDTIRRLLLKHRIRPKSNVKRLIAKPHPERDRQFRYLQSQRQRFAAVGWPIISVDTKKTELIGQFHQPGQVWCREAPAVYMHDFPTDALGRAIPYGIYDVAANRGYVYVGQSADTPDFAVGAIAHWWQHVGRRRYAHAPHLLILADSGGSNGYRPRRWKQQLQIQLADAFELSVTVCHYPPGASKWNPIEHRLFSHISNTWAGTPLTSFDVLLEGIEATETTLGMKVQAQLVPQPYPTGLTVSDEEMTSLRLEKHTTCPDWNYTIRPRHNGK